MPDWSDLFDPTVMPLELILRGTLVYWFLFMAFRFILRRDTGSMGVTDFLFVVLLGDASQNAMIGEATSVSDGFILISTLVFWSLLLDFLCYRFPAIERLAQGRKLCLYRNGMLHRKNMRRELITMEDIMAKLRQEGLESIDQAKAIYLEASGELTIIKLKS